LLNQANSAVYATEKSVKDYGDKISAEDKATIEKELAGLKEAIKTKDAGKINPAMEALQKASHKLAEEVYKATASQQAAGEAPAGDQAQDAGGSGATQGQKADDNKEDIIDADFKAEDDKK
ncbi:MAG: Hsp70 family protein, partial [Candidatus Omnitrophica bacterium]|nr:Hsp70 family protein [Candidatus Omnitrophota bacterium]